MIKMFITNAVVSKGYNGGAAVQYTANGDSKFVRFRVGATVYDKNAENNRRYVNITVKGFNGAAARIEGMKLDAGKYVNITGRYDEDTWEDSATHEKKSAPVLIVDEIEYCFGGTNGAARQSDESSGGAPTSVGSGDTPAAPSGGQQQNFTGFDGFGGANPYFPDK